MPPISWAKLGELIKQEQEAERLATQDTGRPKKCDTNVTLLKDIGLTRKDSERAQKVFEHQDLIAVVVAKAKGVDQATVSRRLKFNSMSDKVKGFMRKSLVDEFHLVEIITLCAAHNLSPWLTTYQAWEELSQDLKIFKMGLLGIPQERIAQRLGVSQDIVSNHLRKSSEMKNGVNNQLERGFGVNTIAEKLDWPSRLGWTPQEIADHPDVTVAQARISQIIKKLDTQQINNL